MDDIAVLLVDEDCKLARALSSWLRDRGHRTDAVADGESAVSVARRGSYDVMILGWALPGISGLDVLRTLRMESLQIPTLFLLDSGQVAELNEAGESASLHYVTKPVEFPVIRSCIERLTQRHEGRGIGLSAGSIEIDLLTRSAKRCGRPLDLSPHEFRLLEFFVRNADRLVTRKMLLQAVWQMDFDPHTSVVESHISRLRKRLNAHAQLDPIQTIRTVGYKLVSPL